jgi:predicted PurR-regulated permease PerM
MLQTTSLYRPVLLLIFVFALVSGLYFAKPFLVPVCFGGLLAMLFLPISRFLENKKVSRGLSILLCILLFLITLFGLLWLISWQVNDVATEVTDIENKVKQMILNLERYVSSHFGIPVRQQEEFLEDQAKNKSEVLANIGPAMLSFAVDFVLVLVYIFLFMYYRSHIKKFILQLVPEKQQENTRIIIRDIQKVSQQYLTGLGLMIICLWVMYSIGFSIVGVKYAVLFAIVCGLLEIVPFVGNLTGNLLTILMVIIQGGSVGMVIGVLITYATVQFLQTYILEPLVVGAEVNINPLFTIIVLVLGELVWGIPGMVLAIPLLGIVKIICDHIESLKPYGYLVGSGRKKKMGLIRRK